MTAAQVLDLSYWKLTLPISYNKSTGAGEVPSSELVKGTEFSPYYVSDVDAHGEYVQFLAPVTGLTTSGSGYPRSELREMKPGGKDLASWGGNDGSYHTLLERIAWDYLPGGKPHVVGGQIHDSADDFSVFRLEGSNLYVTSGDTTHYKLVTDSYVLGTVVDLAFVVGAKKCLAFFNGTLVATLDASKLTGAYFKVGAYTQANKSNADPYNQGNVGGTKVYKVQVTHGSKPGAVTFQDQVPPVDPTPPPVVTPPPVTQPPTEPMPPVTATKIIMIARHGEKPDSKHPGFTDITFSKQDSHSLTANGWIRARDLYPDVFAKPKAGLVKPDQVYAADGPVAGERMKQTASFLSPALGLSTILKFDKGQEKQLAAELKKQVQLGHTPLVIWEHGNIPALVAALGTTTPKMFKTWPDNRYDVVLVLKSTDGGKTWALSQVLEAIGLPGEKTTPIS